METETCALLLECERAGSKVKVTARCQGEAVHIDTVDPASATQRQRFAKALVAKLPQADPDAVEAELIGMADQALPAPEGDGGGDDAPEDDPELREEVEALLKSQSCSRPP